jgi:hypothetical protein
MRKMVACAAILTVISRELPAAGDRALGEDPPSRHQRGLTALN